MKHTILKNINFKSYYLEAQKNTVDYFFINNHIYDLWWESHILRSTEFFDPISNIRDSIRTAVKCF